MTTKEQRHYRCKAVTFKEDDDSDTEVEEFNLESRKSDGRELQIIHSGHFMVSSLHMEHTPKKGYDFDTVNKQTCRTYHFGKTSTSHLSIDASLTKLFECMTLAYSGMLVSPKWKNFKGLKLLWRDKIRLNNAIWRAWHMQYVEKRENPICHFVTPLDGSIETEDQRRPEAIYTDGKCWIRGLDVVREYHKWRTYFKKRLQKHKDEDLSGLLKGSEDQFSLYGEISADILQSDEMGVRRGLARQLDSPIPMDMDSLFDIEVLMSESSDTLFSTLASHQTLSGPNPRDMAHSGNADMIQPGLGNLQPNLDFSLDTFELFQDLFHSYRQPTPSTSFPSSAVPASHPPTSLLPSVTTSPKIPSASMSNHIGEMRSAPPYPGTYPPLFSAPPTPVATVPLAPPLPNAAPRPSLVQRPVARWDPAVGNRLPPCTAVRSPGPPKVAPKPVRPSALPLPRMPQKPRVLPRPVAEGTPPPPAFTAPKPRQAGASNPRARRVPNIVPAQPRPPPPLFITGAFPAHSGTVIIAPSPLQTEAPPPANIVIAPGDIAQGCRQSSAEQKRRFSINLGFRTLCTLVPTLKTKSSSKPVTNAATLQKTVEYIGKLQQDRQQMQEEARRLRDEVEELNASISSCHQKLPATGVPVTRNRLDCMWDKFNEYVRNRTLQNWKFWIFSIIIKPLFESFNSAVSTVSVLELRQTTLLWLEQHCSLLALRPMVLDALLQLSTTSSILTDPGLLPAEACRAVGHSAGNAAEP